MNIEHDQHTLYIVKMHRQNYKTVVIVLLRNKTLWATVILLGIYCHFLPCSYILSSIALLTKIQIKPSKWSYIIVLIIQKRTVGIDKKNSNQIIMLTQIYRYGRQQCISGLKIGQTIMHLGIEKKDSQYISFRIDIFRAIYMHTFKLTNNHKKKKSLHKEFQPDVASINLNTLAN